MLSESLNTNQSLAAAVSSDGNGASRIEHLGVRVRRDLVLPERLRTMAKHNICVCPLKTRLASNPHVVKLESTLSLPLRDF
jgi:hypothetical protein